MATIGYLLLLWMAGMQPVVQAQVFKCTDGGEVSYQSEPCRGPPAKAWAIPSPGRPVVGAHVSGRQAERVEPRARRIGSPAPGRRIAQSRGDACAKAREGRDAAYRKAGLKRGFALSSYWDNRVHDACR